MSIIVRLKNNLQHQPQMSCPRKQQGACTSEQACTGRCCCRCLHARTCPAWQRCCPACQRHLQPWLGGSPWLHLQGKDTRSRFSCMRASGTRLNMYERYGHRDYLPGAALQSSPCRPCSYLGTRLQGCRGFRTRRRVLLLCPCGHARAAHGLLLIRTVCPACAVLMGLGWVNVLLRCRCVLLCCLYAGAWWLVSCCKHASSIRLQQCKAPLPSTCIGQRLSAGSHVTQSIGQRLNTGCTKHRARPLHTSAESIGRGVHVNVMSGKQRLGQLCYDRPNASPAVECF